MTISSKSCSVCAQIDSMESRSQPAPLRLGIMTDALIALPPNTGQNAGPRTTLSVSTVLSPSHKPASVAKNATTSVRSR